MGEDYSINNNYELTDFNQILKKGKAWPKEEVVRLW